MVKKPTEQETITGIRGIVSAEVIRFIDNSIPVIRRFGLMLNESDDHNVDHWARTACNAAAIATLVGDDYTLDQETLLLAGLLHDIGRVDDSADSQHGFRAVVPAIDAMRALAEHGIIRLDLIRFGKVIDLIIHHVELMPGRSIAHKVLKDADKLDMQRHGKGKGALDPYRIELVVSRGLIAIAEKFAQQEWEITA